MVIGPFPFPPDAGGFNPAPAILLSVGGIPAAAIGDCIATGIRVFAGPGSPPTQQAMTATGDIRFLAAYFSAT
jgi:hypothetical protein